MIKIPKIRTHKSQNVGIQIRFTLIISSTTDGLPNNIYIRSEIMANQTLMIKMHERELNYRRASSTLYKKAQWSKKEMTMKVWFDNAAKQEAGITISMGVQKKNNNRLEHNGTYHRVLKEVLVHSDAFWPPHHLRGDRLTTMTNGVWSIGPTSHYNAKCCIGFNKKCGFINWKWTTNASVLKILKGSINLWTYSNSNA